MVQAHRLHKSRDEKVLFGVAGGVADYFDLDPVLVRVGWIVLAIATGGAALLVYLVMAFVMPDRNLSAAHSDSKSAEEVAADQEGPVSETVRRRRYKTRNLLGIGLIAAGVIFLLNNLGVFGFIRWDIVWPATIIALGLVILIPRLRG